MNNRTFAIIKPDAVKNNFDGKIIDHILDSGFKILCAKKIRMTKAQAERFYIIHVGKPFYEELIEFMSSGPSWVLALEKDNAVEEWRNTIGNTNPYDAADGTIRKLYATSLGENAVHGSDSDDNANIEIGFFFSEAELIAAH
jgi:nucleoside-diphosphate kinase